MTEEEQTAADAQMAGTSGGCQGCSSAGGVRKQRTPEATGDYGDYGVTENWIDRRAAGFDENDRPTWGNPSRNDRMVRGSGEKFKACATASLA